jgi:hypothetical protein
MVFKGLWNYLLFLKMPTETRLIISFSVIGRCSPVHCKKRLATFPPPAGMSLIKTFLGGNTVIKIFPPRVSLARDIPARVGIIAKLFYGVSTPVDCSVNEQKLICHRRLLVLFYRFTGGFLYAFSKIVNNFKGAS